MDATYRGGNPTLIPHTPSGAIADGAVVVTADTVRVCHVAIVADEVGTLSARGGWYDCIADAAIADGKKVYWNDSANKVTETSSGNKQIGETASASAADGDVIRIVHNPAP